MLGAEGVGYPNVQRLPRIPGQSVQDLLQALGIPADASVKAKVSVKDALTLDADGEALVGIASCRMND
jgi:hypothetical protein